jgi:3-oxoacyl-[acyl-carrier-protein] synthase I
MVHVFAMAARTAVGITAESAAAAVRARISRVAAHPLFVDSGGDHIGAAVDARLDPTLLGPTRLAALADAAIVELVEKVPLLASLPSPLTAYLALPESRPGFETKATDQVVQELQAAASGRGWRLRVEVAGRGHAGGLEALALATMRLEHRGHELCIVGGADSYFEPDTIDWLQDHRQIIGADVRNGFVPGEGAGFLLIGSEGARRQLRLTSLGVVRGSSVALERKPIKAELINSGEGLAEAIAGASQSLRLPAEAADAVYCDINGERYRSEEWAFAVLRVPHAIKDSAFVAPSDCWGDVGAASGPLGCILALRSWARRYAQGPRALVWAGSEAGVRAAAVLQASSGG